MIPGAASACIQTVITERGFALEFVYGLGGALGMSSGWRIQVVRGLRPATELVVLAHELAHEWLHHGAERPASREARELRAEAVVRGVSHACGLKALVAVVDYVQLYRGDRAALAASLDGIQRTAAAILTAMDGA